MLLGLMIEERLGSRLLQICSLEILLIQIVLRELQLILPLINVKQDEKNIKHRSRQRRQKQRGKQANLQHLDLEKAITKTEKELKRRS